MKTAIDLAREAGFVEYELEDHTPSGYDIRYERLVELVRAEMREAWQPIETAPKDSTSILIYCPKNERKPVCEAWWAIAFEGDHGGHWQTPVGPNGRGYTILPSAPTHWMSLLVAPAAIRATPITPASTSPQEAVQKYS